MINANNKPLSITKIMAMKDEGEKIACLTAYDASFAAVIDGVGIDVILVGDSLGMVFQGRENTLVVTIQEMVYHTQCVNRARQRAYLIADLPFMTYSTPENAAMNAAMLIQQGGAQMVKLEGSRLDCINFLVKQGIPVCGHLGLLPQSIHQMGGYHVQGKMPEDADRIRTDAKKIQDAGATMLVLECIPAVLAKEITKELSIPVIGIGAGVNCDGQILVLYDLLNIGIAKRPKFSKDFMAGNQSIEDAIRAYCQAVKSGQFPGDEHSY